MRVKFNNFRGIASFLAARFCRLAQPRMTDKTTAARHCESQLLKIKQ